ncbi:MAG: rod shape-determining protein MreC [Clostridiaceae bacterium]
MKFLKNKLTVTIILLSVTFLIFIGYSVNREKNTFIENGFGVVINSVQGVIYKVSNSINDSLYFLFNMSAIKDENEELSKNNLELEQKLLKYDNLKSENERFKSMLNFKDEMAQYEYLGCEIISKSGNNYLDGYTINRGYKDGIRNGMVVVVAEGLVGQVTSTSDNWSVVSALSNENIAVAALIKNTNEDIGIVKGYRDSDNQLLAKVYYLPIDSEIKVNDIILTSGTGGLYPKGIRIGEVLSVEENIGKVMKISVIKPYVNFNKISEVYVIVPKSVDETTGEVQY